MAACDNVMTDIAIKEFTKCEVPQQIEMEDDSTNGQDEE